SASAWHSRCNETEPTSLQLVPGTRGVTIRELFVPKGRGEARHGGTFACIDSRDTFSRAGESRRLDEAPHDCARERRARGRAAGGRLRLEQEKGNGGRGNRVQGSGDVEGDPPAYLVSHSR